MNTDDKKGELESGKSQTYLLELGITWFGNLAGTFLTAMMVRNSRIYENITEKGMAAAATKLSDNFFSIFLLAIFCGMLMFIAVDINKTQQGTVLVVC